MSWGNIILKAVMMTVVLCLVTADAWGRDPRIDWSLAIAERWWGPLPHCQEVEIILGFDDPEDGVGGWAVRGGCTIWLDRSFMNRGRVATWRLCGIMVHEYGHLTGRGHSDDPWDVMYPVVEATPTPCYRWHRERARARAIRRLWRRSNATR